jgi:hypothetical protein
MAHVMTTPDIRCAVCHRRDHRAGTWDGHQYETPAHIVMSINGKRTRLFPVVQGHLVRPTTA